MSTKQTGRPKKGRKLKFGEFNRSERKQRKYTNQSYVNTKGKQISPKVFSDYDCQCQQKCNEQVSRNLREIAFNSFYELGSYNAQTMFILANVKQVPKKRSYRVVTTGSSNTTSNKQKQFSRIYSLSGIKVCREMFIKTLGISPQRVTVCLKKARSHSLVDLRGKNQGGWNTLLLEDKQIIMDHINSIPRYQSEYRRASCSDAMFLQNNMTIKKLYELYNELLTQKFPNRKAVSFATYKKIYLKNFNLKTKPLHKYLNA